MKKQYFLLLAAISCMTLMAFNPKEPERACGPVYITAAHIPSEDLPGYTLMYSDTERDTAYYLKDDYTYHYPNIGEMVVVDGNTCKVTSIQQGIGFNVKCEKAYRGMSGSRVTNTAGEEIGFVSKSQPNGELLCIAIR